MNLFPLDYFTKEKAENILEFSPAWCEKIMRGRKKGREAPFHSKPAQVIDSRSQPLRGAGKASLPRALHHLHSMTLRPSICALSSDAQVLGKGPNAVRTANRLPARSPAGVKAE